MILQKNTYRILLTPQDKFHNVKLSVDDILDINKLVKSIETYGVVLEGLDEEFIHYAVHFVIDVYELIVCNSVLGIPLKVQEFDRKIIFVNEGRNNLRMFLK